MNTYETLDELWMGTVQQIFDGGHSIPSRDGPTREIMGFVARLKDPRCNFMFNPIRRMSPWYAAAELIWYLSGDDDITMPMAYAPQYERFANGPQDDGLHAYGAYGKRWLKYLQLDDIIQQLTQTPGSRQAVMTCWEPTDLAAATDYGHNDIPCTLSLHFLLRDELLYLTVTMRSNDVWLGVPYDIWSFTWLQHLVAYALKARGVPIKGLGWYQHQVGSMHLYSRNSVRAKQAINSGEFGTGPLDINHHSEPYMKEHVDQMVKLEKWNREKGTYSKSSRQAFAPPSLWSHLLAMAAMKWDPEGVLKHAKGIDKDLKTYMKWLHERQK